MNYKIVNRRKRFFVRMADRLIDLAYLFRRKQPCTPLLLDRDRIRRILVVRLAYIGDVIMTEPVLPALRESFPGAEIHVLTSPDAAELLQHNPNLDTIIPFRAKWFYSAHDHTGAMVRHLARQTYDLGIDFRGDIRNIFYCLFRPRIPRRLSYGSGGGGRLLTHEAVWQTTRHKTEYHLDLLRQAGIPAASRNPAIHLLETEIHKANDLLDSLGIGPAPIMIHPSARLPLKLWPESRFTALIDQLAVRTAHPVILAGGPGDRPRAASIHAALKQPERCVNITGKLEMREFAALASRSACVLCHDSAAMHIAAAVNTRVVALFGPSRPMETAPSGDGHTVMEGPCPVKDQCDEHSCSETPKQQCMMSITAAEVLNAVLNILPPGHGSLPEENQ